LRDAKLDCGAMRRILFFVSSCCLVVAVAIFLLCLRGLIGRSTIAVSEPPRQWYISFSLAHVALNAKFYPDASVRPTSYPIVDRRLLGFAYESTYWYSTPPRPDGSQVYGSWRTWSAPVWAVIPLPLLLGLYSVRVMIAQARLRHRRRMGYCLHCGYNLTGNVSGVCPECGTPVVR
jgi:hypothetical protein